MKHLEIAIAGFDVVVVSEVPVFAAHPAFDWGKVEVAAEAKVEIGG